MQGDRKRTPIPRRENERKAEKESPVTTYQLSQEEMKERGYTQTKAEISSIEWFVDEKLSTHPTIGFNKDGILFNRWAANLLKVESGQCLSVGFDAAANQLIFKHAENGLRLSKRNKNGALALVNKRLVNWLQLKVVDTKRCMLYKNEKQDMYYIELERHARSEIEK